MFVAQKWCQSFSCGAMLVLVLLSALLQVCAGRSPQWLPKHPSCGKELGLILCGRKGNSSSPTSPWDRDAQSKTCAGTAGLTHIICLLRETREEGTFHHYHSVSMWIPLRDTPRREGCWWYPKTQIWGELSRGVSVMPSTLCPRCTFCCGGVEQLA